MSDGNCSNGRVNENLSESSTSNELHVTDYNLDI